MTHADQVLRSGKEREMVNAVVRALRAAAPFGWERLALEFRAAVGIDSVLFEIHDAQGSRRTAMPPGQALGKMDELRRVMYRHGKGAWFTARLEVERTGRFSAEFDYDGEPGFSPALSGATCRADLDRFPRSDAHIPDWLRERLIGD